MRQRFDSLLLLQCNLLLTRLTITGMVNLFVIAVVQTWSFDNYVEISVGVSRAAVGEPRFTSHPGSKSTGFLGIPTPKTPHPKPHTNSLKAHTRRGKTRRHPSSEGSGGTIPSPHPSPLTPHPLTPHPSPLTPHPLPLTPHPSSLTPRPSPLIPHPSPLTLHLSTLNPQPSLLNPSLLTPHSSPLIPHPSPLTHARQNRNPEP